MLDFVGGRGDGEGSRGEEGAARAQLFLFYSFFFKFLRLLSARNAFARRGLGKVVKHICSWEGREEKRLPVMGQQHKGKIVHWKH